MVSAMCSRMNYSKLYSGEKKVVTPDKQWLSICESAQYAEICESGVLGAARLTESTPLKKVSIGNEI